MTLRQEHETHAPGNRLAAGHLTLPCSAAQFEQAVRDVHHQMSTARATRQRDVMRLAMRLIPARLGAHACNRFTAGEAAPVIASTVVFPRTFTCMGGRLRAASIFTDLSNDQVCYASFTRAAGVVRCGVIYDSALAQGHSVPGLWAAAMASGC